MYKDDVCRHRLFLEDMETGMLSDRINFLLVLHSSRLANVLQQFSSFGDNRAIHVSSRRALEFILGDDAPIENAKVLE
jgi:hypothetical protein